MNAAFTEKEQRDDRFSPPEKATGRVRSLDDKIMIIGYNPLSLLFSLLFRSTGLPVVFPMSLLVFPATVEHALTSRALAKRARNNFFFATESAFLEI